MELEIVYFSPQVTKDSSRNIWIVDKTKKKAYILNKELLEEFLKLNIPKYTSYKSRKIWAEENKITLIWREPTEKEARVLRSKYVLVPVLLDLPEEEKELDEEKEKIEDFDLKDKEEPSEEVSNSYKKTTVKVKD